MHLVYSIQYSVFLVNFFLNLIIFVEFFYLSLFKNKKEEFINKGTPLNLSVKTKYFDIELDPKLKFRDNVAGISRAQKENVSV